jgi:hypothetical protein
MSSNGSRPELITDSPANSPVSLMIGDLKSAAEPRRLRESASRNAECVCKMELIATAASARSRGCFTVDVVSESMRRSKQSEKRADTGIGDGLGRRESMRET